MSGGFVRIAGPPNAPWNLQNIQVVVTKSLIAATLGPAVGIELGYGWPNKTATRFAVTNVTLLATKSTLSSESTSGVASALGYVNVDPTGGSSTLALTDVVVAASYCTLIASGATAAVVAGVAVAQANDVLIVHSRFSLASTNAVASAKSSSNTAAASSIGGVALGSVASVTVNATELYFSMGSASSTSSGIYGVASAYGVSSIAGIAVGFASTGAISINHNTQYVAGINVTNNCNKTSTSSGSNSYAASSIAGISVGYSSDIFSIFNCTQFVSRISGSIFTWSLSPATYDACIASSIAGVSAGYSFGDITVKNCTQYVYASNVTSNIGCLGSNAAWSASTIGGADFGYASGFITLRNLTQYVSWTNASSNSSSTSSSSFATSNVGGITSPRPPSVSDVLKVLSLSLVAACAQGQTIAVTCGVTPASGLCCTKNSLTGIYLPPPNINVDSFILSTQNYRRSRTASVTHGTASRSSSETSSRKVSRSNSSSQTPTWTPTFRQSASLSSTVSPSHTFPSVSRASDSASSTVSDTSLSFSWASRTAPQSQSVTGTRTRRSASTTGAASYSNQSTLSLTVSPSASSSRSQVMSLGECVEVTRLGRIEIDECEVTTKVATRGVDLIEGSVDASDRLLAFKHVRHSGESSDVRGGAHADSDEGRREVDGLRFDKEQQPRYGQGGEQHRRWCTLAEAKRREEEGGHQISEVQGGQSPSVLGIRGD